MAFTRQHNWKAIKEAIESGIPATEVAKTFKVTVAVIRNKSAKERWASPNRVRIQMKEMAKAGLMPDTMTKREMQKAIKKSGVSEKASLPATETTNDTVTQKSAETGSHVYDPRIGYADAVAYHVAKKVQQALPNMPDPRSWRDLNTADAMARRALGLDKQVVKAAGLFSSGGVQAGIALEFSSMDGVDPCADTAENGWFDSQE